MSNEITVKLKCSIAELCNILEEKGFKVIDRYILNDIYYIPKELNTNNMNAREILSKAILLRDINDLTLNQKFIKFTFKRKKIEENGEILEQNKVNCEISSLEDGKTFIESIGYIKLMSIQENDTVYEKNGLNVLIKEIKNGDNLLEVETVEENEELDTIEKIKQKINELNIPIDTNDYFIKKAEIELVKILYREQ